MPKHVLLFLSLALPAFAAPTHLRTNALLNPLGIDTPSPTFSWQSDARTPNWTQSAYEIVVTSENKPVWDSGRVSSSESVNIAYAGPALVAQHRYTWHVMTWDSKNLKSSSQPATFETGLLSSSDWKAQWITRPNNAAEAELKDIRWIWLAKADPTKVPSATPAQFRYTLHLDAAPQAASLHVLVRGAFTASVNGHPTGHHDEWGAFDREEIAPWLHAGNNEILLDVTSHQAGKPSASAVAAAIHVTRADGVLSRIVTNAKWESRPNAKSAWAPAAVAGPLSAPFDTGTDRETAVLGPAIITAEPSILKKAFTLPTTVKSARLTITALGAYQASLNGKPIAPGTLLSPGWTDFSKRVLYQTYDVTPLLTRGPNSLDVLLGGGWFSSPMTWIGFRSYNGPNLLRAQLDLTLANGTHQTIATDPSWKTAPAPITFAEIYGGESYDARLTEPKDWAHAAVAEPANSGLTLTAEPDLPITHSLTIKPIHLDPASAAHPAIFDMGQNMVGNIRIHVQGPRGSVLRLRYAERLNPDGSIYTQNLRNADATDTYTLSGKGPETWTPTFTFHGFRYVEFTELSPGRISPLTLASIEGLVQNSLPTTPSVRLTSSSDLLNKMNELGAWGQRGNFVSIPTDCPQRDERLGWMGDAGAFWRTGTYNFDIDAFTRKFMLDVTDAQTPAGAFTDVSPNILGPNPGAPGWGDAGIFVPYAAWLQYGDLTTVERSWPAMQRWMDFILANNPDHLRKKALGNDYADWLAPDPHTPGDLIGTAYWALVAREMVEMATALHHADEAATYQQLYDEIATAYRKAYVKADGSVEGNTQTGYLATLFTEIAPPELKANMVDRLVADITAHKTHLTTGFLGTPFLLSVLDANGHTDLAFKLLLSDTYPSWGYMISKGATTWWERWNGDTGDPGMNSYNHYAFGSVMAWVYRRAAGIDTDAMGPGFHHLTIQPHFDPALPALHTEYDSAYGTVVSDLKNHRFTVTIPANTTATVILPGKTEQIGSGTHSYPAP